MEKREIYRFVVIYERKPCEIYIIEIFVSNSIPNRRTNIAKSTQNLPQNRWWSCCTPKESDRLILKNSNFTVIQKYMIGIIFNIIERIKCYN